MRCVGIAQRAGLVATDQFRTTVVGTRVQAELRAVLGQQREISLIMGNDSRRDVAEMSKDVADVQGARQRGQQIAKRFELPDMGSRMLSHRRHSSVRRRTVPTLYLYVERRGPESTT
jgi:hypothetical protein